jgi:hypothetical protein
MKPHSPEHRAKLSAALKGRPPSEACLKAAVVAKRALAAKAEPKPKPAPAERKRRVMSPETRAKMAEAHRRGKLTPKWVPEDLLADFRDVLLETKDEFAACAHVRALLREMRV